MLRYSSGEYLPRSKSTSAPRSIRAIRSHLASLLVLRFMSTAVMKIS
jgi:hypothetical protein